MTVWVPRQTLENTNTLNINTNIDTFNIESTIIHFNMSTQNTGDIDRYVKLFSLFIGQTFSQKSWLSAGSNVLLSSGFGLFTIYFNLPFRYTNNNEAKE